MDQNDVATLYGANVVDENGDKVGKVGQVYLDDQTSRPEWVTVGTGLFGTNETFIPVRQATLTGGEVRVPYSKSFIKDAPNMDPESGHLDEAQENELYRYYGIGDSSYGTETTGYAQSGTAGYSETTTTTTSGTTGGGVAGAVAGAVNRVTGRDDRTDTVGHDTSGPNTDDAMTRSEERLRVGTERVQTGRARLRKYIVSENVTTTVPVSHEEVRIEREPITDANRGAAYSGKDLSEEEHEVTLTAERPVVQKEVEAVERVRLDKEVVTEQERVSADVRKEQIEVEGGTETVRDRDITR